MNATTKILVTAANGNTGFPTAKTLLALGFEVRAFVRNPNTPKAKELKKLGAELFVGDIEDIRDTREALKGIKRAFFTPTYPNVLFQGETFATAAEETGLEHVVLLTQWISSQSHPSNYTKEHWLVDQAFKRLPTVDVTIVNPGFFAFSYFFLFEPVAQFGMMPEFGSNAPPSNEDIGAVAAHILKSPSVHAGQTYRITGKDVLTSQQKAKIFEKILGRKVKVQNLPEKIIMKLFKSKGFSIRDYSQIRYYIRDGQNGVFAKGGVTTVVKDIIGRDAEDFETIARRYINQDPSAKQGLVNRLKALKNMMKMILTPAPDLEKYETERGIPKFKNMNLSSHSDEWAIEHKI